MAEEEQRSFDQLMRTVGDAAGGGGGERPRFIPVIFGMMEPTAAGTSERIVLVNPLTQGMVVLHGSTGLLSTILSGGASAPGAGGPPPASKASIEALKSVEVGEEEETEAECPVCLDPLRSVEEGAAAAAAAAAKEMPCGHRFHGGCIEKWLGMRGSCPMCRHRMPEEEEGEGKKGGGEEEGERRGGEVWFTISLARRQDGEAREEDEEEGGS